jgi:hypothetical protein
MRYFFLFFSACLVWVSCRNNEKIPSHILPPEKMQPVMWDMIRADQFLADYVFSRDTTLSRKEESIQLYREILALHGLTQEQFRESYYYYRSRPDLLRVIMDSLSKLPALPAADTTAPRLITDTIPVTERKKDTVAPVTPRAPIPLD